MDDMGLILDYIGGFILAGVILVAWFWAEAAKQNFRSRPSDDRDPNRKSFRIMSSL